MRGLSLLLAFAVASSAGAAPAWARDVPPPPPVIESVRSQASWVQMTADGAELRVVYPLKYGACPVAFVDGVPSGMMTRAVADEAFPAVCSLRIPRGAKMVKAADGPTLKAPRARVDRIVVFGDSGCRLKGLAVQACNDPRAWPFAEVARHAAARHPDLVIHVGDYYYRESPCPIGDLRCAGSPSGDRWGAWAADFFDPAAPLLVEAPWVFVRGNHESCSRGGLGWFRLLDAAAAAKSCPAEASAWTAQLGGLNLYILDSADTVDERAEPGPVAQFAAAFKALAPALAHDPGWVVVHRPIWGLAPVARLGPLGPLNVTLNATEQSAARGRDLDAVRMVLSGHVHHFSSFDFAGRRPAQLVVGTGGDVGSAADSPRITRDEVRIDDLDARHTEFDRFGYMVLDRVGQGPDRWRGIFYDADDRPVVDCTLDRRRLSCEPAR